MNPLFLLGIEAVFQTDCDEVARAYLKGGFVLLGVFPHSKVDRHLRLVSGVLYVLGDGKVNRMMAAQDRNPEQRKD